MESDGWTDGLGDGGSTRCFRAFSRCFTLMATRVSVRIVRRMTCVAPTLVTIFSTGQRKRNSYRPLAEIITTRGKREGFGVRSLARLVLEFMYENGSWVRGCQIDRMFSRHRVNREKYHERSVAYECSPKPSNEPLNKWSPYEDLRQTWGSM